MACRNEFDWLITCCHGAVNNCPKEYCPPMFLSVSSYHINKMVKSAEMTEKGILPPTLKIILKTHCPLPVKQKPPTQPSSGIPPSSSPLPSTDPRSLGEDQIVTEEMFLGARTDDTTGKKGRMEPERVDQYKQGEIPLL